MSPLASICIPTFNGSPWLRESLASAAAQTLDDLEIRIVDDLSTDDTLAVAKDFAEEDTRVVVQQNPRHLGLAANWNRVIRTAQGQWIKLLFQDDLLEPECLARMVAAGSEAEDQALVICDRRVDVAPDTTEATCHWFQDLPRMDDLFGARERVSSEQVSEALARHPSINFFGEPTAALLHRTLFERFGIFNEHMIQLCDLEFIARVASQTGLLRVREELVTFRVHAGSTSSTNAASQLYRKDVLDPLILYHQYAFDEAYMGLRRVAAAQKPPVSFASLAARLLRRAKRGARNSPDPALQQELARVVSAHPKLARPLWQLWYLLRRGLASQS